MVEYPLRIFLDLSTAHVSQQTCEWLKYADVDTHWVSQTPYGWFIYADEENGSGDIPDDLFRCMQKAREMGAKYILFDCDAQPWPDLEIFE